MSPLGSVFVVDRLPTYRYKFASPASNPMGSWLNDSNRTRLFVHEAANSMQLRRLTRQARHGSEARRPPRARVRFFKVSGRFRTRVAMRLIVTDDDPERG